MFVGGAVLTQKTGAPLPVRVSPGIPSIDKWPPRSRKSRDFIDLRLAQVIAVTVEPHHSALAKVLEEADVEFANLPEPVRSGSKFTMLLSLLGSEEARPVPALWIARP
jgi:hypothetical protein